MLPSVLLNRLLSRCRFRHLQMLVKLAELGSLKRTAEALGLTQPAVTHLLKDLEELLETQLFYRHARGVRPTAMGAALLPSARRILDTLAHGAEMVATRHGEAQGAVRVASITGGISGLLVRALPAFNAVRPEIVVQVAEVDVEQLGLAVARRDADLVLCRRPSILPEGWTFSPLLEDRFVVVSRPDHPLAGRTSIRFDELQPELWLPLPIATAAQTLFEDLTQNWDPPAKTCRIITRAPSLSWSLLEQTDMISLVPHSVVRQLVEAGQYKILHLDAVYPFGSIGVMRLEDEPGAAALQLADFLAKYAAASP
ncbi:LysR family transcriptional regulator [Variovorax guangxiensis]|jgi:DNA-binding transcriptional LysR family regulator|nr:LysR family transcriptional regulator [Variovorax guangxiensis]